MKEWEHEPSQVNLFPDSARQEYREESLNAHPNSVLSKLFQQKQVNPFVSPLSESLKNGIEFHMLQRPTNDIQDECNNEEATMLDIQVDRRSLPMQCNSNDELKGVDKSSLQQCQQQNYIQRHSHEKISKTKKIKKNPNFFNNILENNIIMLAAQKENKVQQQNLIQFFAQEKDFLQNIYGTHFINQSPSQTLISAENPSPFSNKKVVGEKNLINIEKDEEEKSPRLIISHTENVGNHFLSGFSKQLSKTRQSIAVSEGAMRKVKQFIFHLKNSTTGLKDIRFINKYRLGLINDLSFFPKQDTISIESDIYRLGERLKKRLQISKMMFIIDPCSIMKTLWDYVMVLYCIAVLVILPIDSFILTYTHSESVFDEDLQIGYACCLAFSFADIISRFSTGIYKQGQSILDPTIIAHTYITGNFFVDILSSLPMLLSKQTTFFKY